MTVLARARRAVQTAAIAWIDPHFDRRHPGACGRSLIRWAAPAVRMLQPNDKWNIGAFIPEWLRAIRMPPVAPLPPAKRIFMFSCYRGRFTQDLILAVLLAWRGHKVTVGYLPKLQSPIREPLADDASARPYLTALLADIGAQTERRIECVDLSEWQSPESSLDRDFLRRQLHADVVMAAGVETYSRSDPKVGSMVDHFESMGRHSQSAALAYLLAHRSEIDLCLISNGGTHEDAQVLRASEMVGIPVNTYEKLSMQGQWVLNHGGEFTNFDDVVRIWSRRHELGLCEEPLRSEIIAAGRRLLAERRDSRGQHWSWKLQAGKASRTADEVRAAIGVNEPFALICPNIPFDAGYRNMAGIFPTMREWLLTTVDVLTRCGKKIVLRAHPAERLLGIDNAKRVSNIVPKHLIETGALVFLPPEHPVNTYDLMGCCDFGAVFSSTTGIELAMHGKRVLLGAEIYFGRRGFTLEATDKRDFEEKLVRMAAGEFGLAPGRAEDAAMFYFILHYLFHWPFPYLRPSHVSAMPPRRVVSDATVKRYLSTLDAMALTAAEWDAALATYITPVNVRARAQ